MNHVVTLRLPDDLGGRLDALAKRTHRTKAFYLREALEAHIEDLEDAYLATEVSRQVADGTQSVHEWADVMKELGLDDMAEVPKSTN